jgi:hypothetical protein
MFMVLVASAFERNEHGEPRRDTMSSLPSDSSAVRMHVRICKPEHVPTGHYSIPVYISVVAVPSVV